MRLAKINSPDVPDVNSTASRCGCRGDRCSHGSAVTTQQELPVTAWVTQSLQTGDARGRFVGEPDGPRSGNGLCEPSPLVRIRDIGQNRGVEDHSRCIGGCLSEQQITSVTRLPRIRRGGCAATIAAAACSWSRRCSSPGHTSASSQARVSGSAMSSGLRSSPARHVTCTGPTGIIVGGSLGMRRPAPSGSVARSAVAPRIDSRSDRGRGTGPPKHPPR